jgi:hypothetical protein
MNAGELGGGATGDLGSPERDQLPLSRQYSVPIPPYFLGCNVRLEVGKLRRELVLGLAPELGGSLRRL